MDFKAILVATDFSECAGAAFKVAKNLARQFGAKIVLLHVIQQRIVARVAEHLKVEPDSLLPAFREEAQQHLDTFLQSCCCDNLEVTSMVTVGIPFQEIAVVARDLAADLIVMEAMAGAAGDPLRRSFSAPPPKRWCACCPAQCCVCR